MESYFRGGSEAEEEEVEAPSDASSVIVEDHKEGLEPEPQGKEGSNREVKLRSAKFLCEMFSAGFVLST